MDRLPTLELGDCDVPPHSRAISVAVATLVVRLSERRGSVRCRHTSGTTDQRPYEGRRLRKLATRKLDDCEAGSLDGLERRPVTVETVRDDLIQPVQLIPPARDP